jgi:hypothetical protein
MRNLLTRRGRVAAAVVVAIAFGSASALAASATGIAAHVSPTSAARGPICRSAKTMWQCVRVRSSVRVETVTLWADTRQFASVSCADDEVATGGGYDSNPHSPTLTVFQNGPLFDGNAGDAPLAWVVDAKAADDVQLQVFAICARIDRRIPETG